MPLGGLLVSAAGTALGGLAANATGAGSSDPMQAVLQDLESAATDQINAAQQAAGISEQTANMEISELQNMYQQATSAVTDYYNLGVADVAPYVSNGLTAADALAQSQGLPTVTGGSAALQAALSQNATYQNALNTYNSQVNAAGGANGGLIPAATAAAIANGTYNNAPTYTSANTPTANLQGGVSSSPQSLSAQNFQNSLQSIFNGSTPTSLFNSSNLGTGTAEQQYQAAQQYAKTAQGVIGQYGAGLKNAGQYTTDEQQLNALLQQYQGGFTTAGAAPTNPLSAQQQALVTAYQNGTTPMTATTNPLAGFAASGQGQLQNYNPNEGLIQNFQQTSPGYQFQLQQGQNAIRNSASASGFLNNPNYQTALDQYTTGLANQSFNQYQTNLTNAFGNYQNTLAGVANQGQAASTTQANLAQGAGTSLANAATGLGTNVAGVQGTTGTNLANSALAQGSAAANYQTQAASIAAQQAGTGASLAGLSAGTGGSAGNVGGSVGGTLGTFL